MKVPLLLPLTDQAPARRRAGKPACKNRLVRLCRWCWSNFLGNWVSIRRRFIFRSL